MRQLKQKAQEKADALNAFLTGELPQPIKTGKKKNKKTG
jgi:hypothetical protein